MKDTKSLIIAILLGALSVLALGQRAAVTPSLPGRYLAVPSSAASGGAYITDTTTGATKFVVGRPQGDPRPSPLGLPFDQRAADCIGPSLPLATRTASRRVRAVV
ncbi:MAG: hypothetical protein HYV75_08620 [Opitutae bacterium]|nr:hypothetical protein [Opitutae bacterium]